MKKGVNKGNSPIYAIPLIQYELGSNPTLCAYFTGFAGCRGDFVVNFISFLINSLIAPCLLSWLFNHSMTSASVAVFNFKCIWIVCTSSYLRTAFFCASVVMSLSPSLLGAFAPVLVYASSNPLALSS